MTNKDFFIQTWKSEIPRTMAAVKGLPADMDKLNYKCDEKARSAAEIIGHILPHAQALCDATTSFVVVEGNGKKFNDIAEAADYFEQYAAQLTADLSTVSDTTWEEQVVSFELNGNKIFEQPMSAMYWMFMFDIIHHRGQLSTYYRHMGVRNPAIYGPTAEDIEAMMAQVNN
ncbi:MAG: DinB family protein [Ferruginibacter sp.]